MIAKQGQSFCDLVIQGTGDIENLFATALLNGLSITDNLIIGQEIKFTGKENKSILDLWSENNLPATAITDQDLDVIVSYDGIGVMIIEENFIVR